jgi:hypothetical protein
MDITVRRSDAVGAEDAMCSVKAREIVGKDAGCHVADAS